MAPITAAEAALAFASSTLPQATARPIRVRRAVPDDETVEKDPIHTTDPLGAGGRILQQALNEDKAKAEAKFAASYVSVTSDLPDTVFTSFTDQEAWKADANLASASAEAVGVEDGGYWQRYDYDKDHIKVAGLEPMQWFVFLSHWHRLFLTCQCL